MDPLFDGSGEDHIVDHDVVGLADPVDPADALLDPHGVPGQVVVDGDMTELEVEAFAPGLSGDHDPGVGCEGLLSPAAFVHVHRAVEADDGKSSCGEVFGEHLLGRDELGEDEELEVGVVLFAATGVDEVDEAFGLCVGPGGLAPPGKVEEVTNLFRLRLV